ncbi:Non-catalytic module family DOC2, partial [Piromyces sp. E2]
CWATSLGYPCCSFTKEIFFTDQNGNWGIENDNWCGINTSNENNNQNASNCWSLPLGFQCCVNTNEVAYIDQDGNWGIENGNWCGI